MTQTAILDIPAILSLSISLAVQIKTGWTAFNFPTIFSYQSHKESLKTIIIVPFWPIVARMSSV